MREMIMTCLANALKFRYVLMDSWFAKSLSDLRLNTPLSS